MTQLLNFATAQRLQNRKSPFRRGFFSNTPTRNKAGLPIGFAKDVATWGEEYVGLTCAAWHTAKIRLETKGIIVEGGPAMAHFWTFLTDVTSALEW
jgi:hypothetical protein